MGHVWPETLREEQWTVWTHEMPSAFGVILLFRDDRCDVVAHSRKLTEPGLSLVFVSSGKVGNTVGPFQGFHRGCFMKSSVYFCGCGSTSTIYLATPEQDGDSDEQNSPTLPTLLSFGLSLATAHPSSLFACGV